MQSSSLFNKSSLEFRDDVREVKLPNSNDPSDIGHSIRIMNRANSSLLIKTSRKNWNLSPKASASFSYDGSSWTKQGAAPVRREKVVCPPDDTTTTTDRSDSESSCDDHCKPQRGPRGYPGKDGCPGANGLNGLNGKNGVCKCHECVVTRVDYSGTALQFPTTLAVPCWACTATVTAVGGGGAGGAANTETQVAGSGGGSGFSTTQVIPVSGGFLSALVGQGGQVGPSTNGQPTTVSYVGPLPYQVVAQGGNAGGAATVLPTTQSNGWYAGGGGDGVALTSLPGTSVIPGEAAVHLVRGGNGAGNPGGLGGITNAVASVYGAGGGGDAPGPVNGIGGNGGGFNAVTPATQLNGTAGTYGGGGGGAGFTALLPPTAGVAGAGGNGYIEVVFSC